AEPSRTRTRTPPRPRTAPVRSPCRESRPMHRASRACITSGWTRATPAPRSGPGTSGRGVSVPHRHLPNRPDYADRRGPAERLFEHAVRELGLAAPLEAAQPVDLAALDAEAIDVALEREHLAALGGGERRAEKDHVPRLHLFQ